MGRKAHEPTEEDRYAVEMMSGHGIPELEVARVLGLSVSTLRKWYGDELDTGHTKANSQVAKALYNKALGNGQGAVTACIFWLKCRANWVEPRPQDAMPGRKELQQKAAATAGGSGTGWAGDLDTDIVPIN